MADLLNVSQAEVSKMERRGELSIGSTGGLADLASDKVPVRPRSGRWSSSERLRRARRGNSISRRSRGARSSASETCSPTATG
jgi:hypothetical protein